MPIYVFFLSISDVMVSKGGSIIRGTLHRAPIQAASGEGGEGGGWRVEGRDGGEGREGGIQYWGANFCSFRG